MKLRKPELIALWVLLAISTTAADHCENYEEVSKFCASYQVSCGLGESTEPMVFPQFQIIEMLTRAFDDISFESLLSSEGNLSQQEVQRLSSVWPCLREEYLGNVKDLIWTVEPDTISEYNPVLPHRYDETKSPFYLPRFPHRSVEQLLWPKFETIVVGREGLITPPKPISQKKPNLMDPFWRLPNRQPTEEKVEDRYVIDYMDIPNYTPDRKKEPINFFLQPNWRFADQKGTPQLPQNEPKDNYFPEIYPQWTPYFKETWPSFEIEDSKSPFEIPETPKEQEFTERYQIRPPKFGLNSDISYHIRESPPSPRVPKRVTPPTEPLFYQNSQTVEVPHRPIVQEFKTPTRTDNYHFNQELPPSLGKFKQFSRPMLSKNPIELKPSFNKYQLQPTVEREELVQEKPSVPNFGFDYGSLNVAPPPRRHPEYSYELSKSPQVIQPSPHHINFKEIPQQFAGEGQQIYPYLYNEGVNIPSRPAMPEQFEFELPQPTPQRFFQKQFFPDLDPPQLRQDKLGLPFVNQIDETFFPFAGPAQRFEEPESVDFFVKPELEEEIILFYDTPVLFDGGQGQMGGFDLDTIPLPEFTNGIDFPGTNFGQVDFGTLDFGSIPTGELPLDRDYLPLIDLLQGLSLPSANSDFGYGQTIIGNSDFNGDNLLLPQLQFSDQSFSNGGIFDRNAFTLDNYNLPSWMNSKQFIVDDDLSHQTIPVYDFIMEPRLEYVNMAEGNDQINLPFNDFSGWNYQGALDAQSLTGVQGANFFDEGFLTGQQNMGLSDMFVGEGFLSGQQNMGLSDMFVGEGFLSGQQNTGLSDMFVDQGFLSGQQNMGLSDMFVDAEVVGGGIVDHQLLQELSQGALASMNTAEDIFTSSGNSIGQGGMIVDDRSLVDFLTLPDSNNMFPDLLSQYEIDGNLRFKRNLKDNKVLQDASVSSAMTNERLEVLEDCSNISNGCKSLCYTRPDGAWIVVQERKRESSVSFNNNWNDYVNGFGNPSTGYWMGLECMHKITSQFPYELSVELEDAAGHKASARYASFRVDGSGDSYKLNLGVFVDGTAGDALKSANGASFTSVDHDNDEFSRNCAAKHGGGWWYRQCQLGTFNNFLNAKFTPTEEAANTGVRWETWNTPAPIVSTRMLIRPSFFTL